MFLESKNAVFVSLKMSYFTKIFIISTLRNCDF